MSWDKTQAKTFVEQAKECEKAAYNVLAIERIEP